MAFLGITSKFSLLPGLLISTMFYALSSLNTDMNPPDTEIVRSEYDFIIVGAGSAGAVIASRLSENKNFQVLLLEAGGDVTASSDIPGKDSVLHNTKSDWNYTVSSSSSFCLGMINKTCSYPRGRVLGGTSTINGMVYARGNKKDYDQWAQDGNYGWSFEEVLPYFKKSEDNQNPSYAENRMYHSTNGELTVSDLRWTSPLGDIFLEAGHELGYINGDFNAQNQTVFGNPQATIRDGYRCSTNKAFLLPAGKRENLDVAKHAHVTKVLIDPATSRAYGVQYFRNGSYHEVYVRKEVILSAGVFHSPQILLLSGIGPKDHLKDFNISVIKDLPVGFNLQDHPGIAVHFLTDKPVTFRPGRFNNNVTKMEYEFNQTGPLATPMVDAYAFMNSKFQNPQDSHPDLMFFISPATAATGGSLGSNSDLYTDELWETIYLPIVDKESFTIYVMLLRPKSIGRVLLKSTNPFENVDVQMNYFDDQDDVLRITDGARLAIKLMTTEAFRQINGSYYYVPIPLCPEAPPLSDEYFECYMRYNTDPFDHAAGTVKMGPKTDVNAVIDPELRVHGISGLRVADASIMPRIVSGNTNAPTIMIGEKAADLIKNSWANER